MTHRVSATNMPEMWKRGGNREFGSAVSKSVIAFLLRTEQAFECKRSNLVYLTVNFRLQFIINSLSVMFTCLLFEANVVTRATTWYFSSLSKERERERERERDSVIVKYPRETKTARNNFKISSTRSKFQTETRQISSYKFTYILSDIIAKCREREEKWKT